MNAPPSSKQWAAFADALEGGSRSLRLDAQTQSLVQSLRALIPHGSLQCTLRDSQKQSTSRADALPGSLTGTLHVAISATPVFRATIDWAGDPAHRDRVASTLREAGITLRPVLIAWATLRSEAVLDPLTQAGNRRALTEYLDAQLALFSRHAIACSVLVLDIVGFKAVNDAQGHDQGDQLLCGLADWLRASIRTEDQLFRYGGDEFVLVLPATDATGARGLAQRLQASDCPVPFSIGMASLHSGEEATALIARADNELIAARQAARG